MRIFMTGATGVMGRRAAPLLAREHSLTTTRVDLFDPDALRRAIDGHDTVINLATHIPDAIWKTMLRRYWAENDRIRSIGARNIVDVARACGVTRLIQESFAPVYPDRGDAWIDETTPLAPTPYNRTVIDAETAAASFAAPDRTAVVLRFAAFYGPDAMQNEMLFRAVEHGWAPMPGGPDRFISSVSHDDAARAVVAALTARSGAYNIVDDEPVRRADYFGSLAATLGVRAPRFLPDWLTPLFGATGEMLARSLRISNRKFRDETGWRPLYPSVREGWPAVVAGTHAAPLRRDTHAHVGHHQEKGPG